MGDMAFFAAEDGFVSVGDLVMVIGPGEDDQSLRVSADIDCTITSIVPTKDLRRVRPTSWDPIKSAAQANDENKISLGRGGALGLGQSGATTTPNSYPLE